MSQYYKEKIFYTNSNNKISIYNNSDGVDLTFVVDRFHMYNEYNDLKEILLLNNS